MYIMYFYNSHPRLTYHILHLLVGPFPTFVSFALISVLVSLIHVIIVNMIFWNNSEIRSEL